MSETTRIVSLELENVKRVRAVAFEPNETGLTVLGGGNAQGKTSVLDAIAYALGGEKFRPSKLQNEEGIAPARMEVVLSNGLRVVREGKNAALKVTDPSGAKSGQKLLDSLLSELALDLPKFLQADDKKKAGWLLQILGVGDELAALDAEERKYSDERLLAGREADRKEHYAAEMQEYPDAPDVPLDGAAISAELTEALARNAGRKAKRELLDGMKDSLARLRKQRDLVLEEIARAEKELEDISCDPPGDDEDTEAISRKLEEIEAVNAKVRANLDKARAADEAAGAREAWKAWTAKIEGVRSRRDSLLASASMPLEGLSVQDGKLIYKGMEWDCMSSMQQLLVGTAICHALKPECGFVLLDKLEQFDPGSLDVFCEWLRNEGLQAIGTRVAVDGTCDIIIEDGCIAEDRRKDKQEETELGDW